MYGLQGAGITSYSGFHTRTVNPEPGATGEQQQSISTRPGLPRIGTSVCVVSMYFDE